VATALRTAGDTRTQNTALILEASIERQNELVRRGEITKENGQGGYTIFGRLIELRYELTGEQKPPEHLRNDLRGLVIDWCNPKYGPLLGRAGQELLVISKVQPLPDIPDPTFQQKTMVIWNNNLTPLVSIPPDMRKGLKNSDGSLVEGTDQEITRPRMMKQRFADHCAGTMGEYMVFRPLTEGLVKLVGVAHLLKVKFESAGATQPGFYLNPATGEGHFLGGKINF
jgi:hypothetical protein